MKSIFFILFIFASKCILGQSFDPKLLDVLNTDFKVQSDPSVDFAKFKSFFLISYNNLALGLKPTLLEKQFEYFLINSISKDLSLRYISQTDPVKPDILIVYNYSNDYKQKTIPPQTLIIPFWTPGTSTNTTINSNSFGSGTVSGDLNLNINSNANSTSTISSTTSGRWSTSQVQRPGYTVGSFYPSVQLSAYQTVDQNKIWEGEATGTTLEDDLRLSAQTLFLSLIRRLPYGSYSDSTVFNIDNGYIGLDWELLTTDGIYFFPMIMSVTPKSPAEKRGIKFMDILIRINGIDAYGKSNTQLDKLFFGKPGFVLNLEILRNEKLIKKTVIKASRTP